MSTSVDVDDTSNPERISDKDRLIRTLTSLGLVVEETYTFTDSSAPVPVFDGKKVRRFYVVRLSIIDAEFVFNADGSFRHLNHLVSEKFAHALNLRRYQPA